MGDKGGSMNNKFRRWLVFSTFILFSILFSACVTAPFPAPTLEPGAVATQAANTLSAQFTLNAAETFAAQLTQYQISTAVASTSIAAATAMATDTYISPSPTPTDIPTLTPLPTSTPLPTATATATQTPTPTPEPCNQAGFIEDLTVPDDTEFLPGARFTKVWRLQNRGTCTWNHSYGLVFVRGNRMQAPIYNPLPASVPPGGTTDLAVDLQAPLAPGDYRGYWMLRSATGILFGLGNQADSPFWVDIRVVPESSPYAYDFSAQMCEATWQSSARALRCPSDRNSPYGSVYYLNDPYLEDGRHENEQTLLTRPESRAAGWIYGVYPAYFVRNNDHFMADIGCLHGNPGCDVVFYLSYQAAGQQMQNLGSWRETYDGETTRVVLDLSHLAGQAVQFILSVTNQGTPSQAQAFWLVPSIRQVQPTPILTSTPTPTATSAPTLNPTPTPTPTPTLTPTPISPENPVVQAARQELAERLGVDIGDIQVLTVESVIWDDTCLGVFLPNQVCTQRRVPGYRIVFSVEGIEFEARTNEDGSIILWVNN
jgi:hypothetical protein